MSSHLLKRMGDRKFTEVDLRRMLEKGTSCRRDIVDGRWIVAARHAGRAWDVIVEPDRAVSQLVIITAYPVES